jgi:hypothetical protein
VFVSVVSPARHELQIKRNLVLILPGANLAAIFLEARTLIRTHRANASATGSPIRKW